MDMQPEEAFVDLPDAIRERVQKLCAEGLRCMAEKGNADDAIYAWEQAVYLLPDPREEWAISCWLFSNIGELYFKAGDYEASDEFFRWAMISPGGRTDPHVSLRLGQSCYHLEQHAEATEYLTAARSENPDILKDEDPIYATFLEK